MKVLKGQDILALGFMTFALFVGAGNIIFPPFVGLQAGPNVWMAALGFLVTAVGLPVITVVALARVGGSMDALSSPIGKLAGGLLAAVCYLAGGPLFATPRTATVSFAVGLAPLTGETPLARSNHQELPSEGTAVGAIQVPASGQPVLFLADHPLTGGYPVIAVVANYHLDLAGQIPVNAWIRFNPVAAFEALHPTAPAPSSPADVERLP